MVDTSGHLTGDRRSGPDNPDADPCTRLCEQTEKGGVSIWTTGGDLITRWNGDRGPGKGTVISGHGICVDSEGSIYVAELAPAARVQKFQKI